VELKGEKWRETYERKNKVKVEEGEERKKGKK
jgi:hypothetical protein